MQRIHCRDLAKVRAQPTESPAQAETAASHGREPPLRAPDRLQCRSTHLKNCSLLRAGVRVTSTPKSVEFAAFQKVWTAGRGHTAVVGASQPATAEMQAAHVRGCRMPAAVRSVSGGWTDAACPLLRLSQQASAKAVFPLAQPELLHTCSRRDAQRLGLGVRWSQLAFLAFQCVGKAARDDLEAFCLLGVYVEWWAGALACMPLSVWHQALATVLQGPLSASTWPQLAAMQCLLSDSMPCTRKDAGPATAWPSLHVGLNAAQSLSHPLQPPVVQQS